MNLLTANVHDLFFRCYVVITFAMGAISLYLSAPALNFLDDALFLLMLITLLGHTHKLRSNSNWSVFVIPVIVIVSVFIAISHGNPIKAVLLSLRQYKNVFLVLILMGLYADQSDFVGKVVKYSLVISLPMAIYQFLMNPSADDVYGVFGAGASGTLSLIITYYVATEFAARVRDGRPRLDWYWLLFLPVLLNETKITFILLPSTMLLLLCFIGKLRLTSLLAAAVGSFVLVFLVDILYEFLYGRTFTEFFSQETFDSYFFAEVDGSDLGRFIRIILAYEYISSLGNIVYWFGEGLGASFVGINSGTFGNAAETFKYSGLNEGSRIQLYHFLIDFGVLGTAVILLYFIWLVCNLFSTRTRNDIGVACVALMFICLVGVLYQNILTNRVISFLTFYYLYVYLMNVRKGGV